MGTLMMVINNVAASNLFRLVMEIKKFNIGDGLHAGLVLSGSDDHAPT
jgi:hypothetical protein